ncbi:HPr(Ser) kinase/phosphatase [Sedimentibacter sp. zth1]|uniref:HPr(Ser) kinase/phosphatase n=1 Tax=Sedimentibacter sp. zth1 TaxID=2816908 RepID=UPI001A92E023|nr:HPr(Ser) kinase/phosphatase [Sedimentibacter sp. zth1]QSX05813.1 HPr(Ser) kinase/phosphatase [Sedimentibacter sp. zth1]
MMYVKAEELEKYLKLDRVHASINIKTVKVYTPEVARPGLQMAGYFDWFSHERIQVLGKTEIYYLRTLEQSVKEERLDKFFSFDIPVVIIANDMEIDDTILKYAKKYDRTIMKTKQKTMKFVNDAISYLEEQLAPEITVHGVCAEVFGIGILLRGKSGIGKSETALELVKRGHRLIADDAVIIRKIDNRVKGYCPELTQHLLEIRGIGILDICHLYGVGSIKIDQFINLVIDLEEWDEQKEYDRLGIDDCRADILDINIPLVTIPVRPGRNIATVLEVAAKNYRQKLLGYNTLDLYNRRFFNVVED